MGTDKKYILLSLYLKVYPLRSLTHGLEYILVNNSKWRSEQEKLELLANMVLVMVHLLERWQRKLKLVNMQNILATSVGKMQLKELQLVYGNVKDAEKQSLVELGLQVHQQLYCEECHQTSERNAGIIILQSSFIFNDFTT